MTAKDLLNNPAWMASIQRQAEIAGYELDKTDIQSLAEDEASDIEFESNKAKEWFGA